MKVIYSGTAEVGDDLGTLVNTYIRYSGIWRTDKQQAFTRRLGVTPQKSKLPLHIFDLSIETYKSSQGDVLVTHIQREKERDRIHTDGETWSGACRLNLLLLT